MYPGCRLHLRLILPTASCLRPPSVAQEEKKGYVRVAELRKGDVLEGPGGAQCVVYNVVKHRRQDRDVVRLQTAKGHFSVTTDHRIVIQGADGSPVPATAQELLSLRRASITCRIFNGTDFEEVLHVQDHVLDVQVVELLFQSDEAQVLAWEFPSRTPRSVRDAAAVACYGRHWSAADLLDQAGIEPNDVLYIAPPSAQPPAAQRASSAPPRQFDPRGVAGNPYSSWSVGTIPHSPEGCSGNVCAVHHRFMAGKASASPCKYGAGCKMCHAAHNELNARGRPVQA